VSSSTAVQGLHLNAGAACGCSRVMLPRKLRPRHHAAAAATAATNACLPRALCAMCAACLCGIVPAQLDFEVVGRLLLLLLLLLMGRGCGPAACRLHRREGQGGRQKAAFSSGYTTLINDEGVSAEAIPTCRCCAGSSRPLQVLLPPLPGSGAAAAVGPWWSSS
jgi:hypothetical protein